MIQVSRRLLLWPSFRQIDLHQMTVRRATFKLLRAALRAPAIVSPAAILIAGLVTGNSSIVLEAFVEHCVSLVLGRTLEFSWLDVSQTDVFHCSSSLDVS